MRHHNFLDTSKSPTPASELHASCVLPADAAILNFLLNILVIYAIMFFR
jgi:hypothetical protein